MEKQFICICCPRGCHLTYKDGVVTGNTCPRGAVYGVQEATNPTRIVTSTFKVNDKIIHVLPCKTSGPIPKGKIFEVMQEIDKVNIPLPVEEHQVIIANVLNLGVDIIATKGSK
jgi:CxxC motif-containing protein